MNENVALKLVKCLLFHLPASGKEKIENAIIMCWGGGEETFLESMKKFCSSHFPSRTENKIPCSIKARLNIHFELHLFFVVNCVIMRNFAIIIDFNLVQSATCMEFCIHLLQTKQLYRVFGGNLRTIIMAIADCKNNVNIIGNLFLIQLYFAGMLT